MKKREIRRDRTWRYAERQRKIRVCFRPDGKEPVRGSYKKRTAMGCRCHRKAHGNPKVAGGMCSRCDNHYITTARTRIDNNRMARKWLKEANGNSRNLLDVEL